MYQAIKLTNGDVVAYWCHTVTLYGVNIGSDNRFLPDDNCTASAQNIILYSVFENYRIK